LEELNGFDLAAVFKAFGSRDYYPWGDAKNLHGWYDEELNDEERSRMAIVWNISEIPYK